jgi:multidrug efflux system membrane fusion protein
MFMSRGAEKNDRSMNEMPSRPYLSAPGETRPGTRKRGWLRLRNFVVLALLLVIGGVTWRLMNQPGAADGRGNRNAPVSVALAPAKTTDIHVTLAELGTVTPIYTVAIRTQISGRLIAVNFVEGQLVKKDQLLVQIDPRPYQYALDTARGTLLRDKAMLADAELDLKRYRTLVAQDSIPSQQLDTQAATVAQLKGTVVSDQAAVDNAQLNLEYCRIIAPFNGRVGLRTVDPGNYVTPSDANNIATLTQIQPISVIFTVPEDSLPKIVKRFNAGNVLPVIARDRAQSTILAKGRLDSIDNQVDVTTGTVKMRALFDNSDGTLFPNQFVNAELQVDVLNNVTAVTTAAVLHGAPGTFVYAAKDDGTVAVRPVTVGPVDGDLTAIISGLNAGEQVVTEGTDRLKDGARIMIREGGPHSDRSKPEDSQGDQRQRRREQTNPSN